VSKSKATAAAMSDKSWNDPGVAEWINEALAKQPEGTLAIFVSVRGGQVQCSRLDEAGMKAFPTDDLSAAKAHIVRQLDAAIRRGPTDDAS
jgi:hypothetical protein